MRHTVLAVCEGNICRSPVVERVLPALLDDSVTVTSAGTKAVPGTPLDLTISGLLSSDGHPTQGFAARQLDAQAVAGATVIMTMTVAQRAAVVALVPSAARRTFTLLELVHLLRASTLPRGRPDDGARWAAIPDAVAGVRHHSGGHRLDIADPYRQSRYRYERAYATIVQALTEVASALHAERDPRESTEQARSLVCSGKSRRTRGNGASGPRHTRG